MEEVMTPKAESTNVAAIRKRLEWIGSKIGPLYDIYNAALTPPDQFVGADRALDKFCREFFPEMRSFCATLLSEVARLERERVGFEADWMALDTAELKIQDDANDILTHRLHEVEQSRDLAEASLAAIKTRWDECLPWIKSCETLAWTHGFKYDGPEGGMKAVFDDLPTAASSLLLRVKAAERQKWALGVLRDERRRIKEAVGYVETGQDDEPRLSDFIEALLKGKAEAAPVMPTKHEITNLLLRLDTATYTEKTDAILALFQTKSAPVEQRTPGTVELCQNHVYKQCRNHGGGMAFEPCKVKPCPLQQTTAAPEK